MDLNERKLQILQAIIGDFIDFAEPVGSRTLSRKYDMGISPATIRNEMSDLEAMGYLTHPHISAGRVPSDKAYRYYVDALMEKAELAPDIKMAISSKLSDNISELEVLIKRAASILSEITNLTSFAMTPKSHDDKLQYIRLLPLEENSVVLMIVAESGKVSSMTLNMKEIYTEANLELLSKIMTYNYKGRTISDAITYDIIKEVEDEAKALSKLAENIMPNFLKTLEEMLNVQLYLDGLTNIFNSPEYNDMYKAKSFLDMLQEKDNFIRKLTSRDQGVIITIGEENEDEILKECSLITATYHIDGRLVGRLGVIGPTRMKYNEVTAVVEYLTENIEKSFRLKEGHEEDEP